MPIQSQWQDRRGMFQRGREISEPSQSTLRRASESSISAAAADALSKVTTNQSTTSTASTAGSKTGHPGSPTSQNYNPGWGLENRRRSSVASAGTGMFANLMNHKRGSEDYHERRSSHAEMEGKNGMMGGIWNSTFRGMQKAKDAAASGGTKDINRGVME